MHSGHTNFTVNLGLKLSTTLKERAFLLYTKDRKKSTIAQQSIKIIATLGDGNAF
jgi:hypothetical protein